MNKKSSCLKKQFGKTMIAVLIFVFVFNFSVFGSAGNALASVHSSFIANQTQPNVTKLNTQTLEIENTVVNNVAGTPGQTAVEANSTPNVAAGTPGQTAVEANSTPNVAAGTPGQTAVEANSTPNVAAGTPGQTAVEANSTPNVAAGTPGQTAVEANSTPNVAAGTPGQTAVEANSTPNRANSEMGLELVYGMPGYTFGFGAAGTVTINRTAAAIDGNPAYDEDENGDDSWDDAVAGLSWADTLAGVAAVQSQTDISIDDAFTVGETLTIDGCTIIFAPDPTGGDQSDITCAGEAGIDIDANATAIAQADKLATLTGLTNYDVNNGGGGGGDEIFRLLHKTVEVDGNPSEGNGEIIDPNNNVSAVLVLAGKQAVNSINTLVITGDIADGAKIKINGNLVITFTTAATNDTDAANDTASIIRFQDAVPQVDTITIGAGNIDAGDTFTATLPGDVDAEYIAQPGDDNEDIAAGLNDAIQNSAGYAGQDFTSAVSVVPNVITLTASEAGTPFTVTTATVNRPAVPQVDTITIGAGNIDAGDTFTATLPGDVDAEYTAQPGDDNEDIAAGLNDAIQNSAGYAGQDFTSAVSVVPNVITLTASEAGTPFTVTTATVNRPAVPQVDTITIGAGNIDAGDTFTATLPGDVDAEYTAQPGDDNEDIAAGLNDAIQNSAGYAGQDFTSAVSVVPNVITLTASEAGTPFTVTTATVNRPAVPQVDTITIGAGNIDAGDTFTATLPGDVDAEYTAQPGDDNADVADGLNDQIQAADGYGDDFTATVLTNVITLTASTPGTPFTVTTATVNRPAVPQVDTITIGAGNIDAGDTFTATLPGDVDAEYTAQPGDDNADVADGLNDQIQAADGYGDDFTATVLTNVITLTASTPGTPFTVTTATVNRPAVPQVDTITIGAGNIDAGDTFTATLPGDVDAEYTAQPGDDNADVADGLNDQIQAADGYGDDFTATVLTNVITLTASTPGTPFTVTTATVNRPISTQIDDLTPTNVESGDEFTIGGVADDDIIITAASTDIGDLVDSLVEAINEAAGVLVTASNNSDVLRLTDNDPGTGFTVTTDTANASSVAQIVTFTPGSVTVNETFNASINGSTYSFKATDSTVKTTVEGLKPLIDASAAVTCTEDDTKVVCAADSAGTEFTYSVSITEAPSSGGGGGGGGAYIPVSNCVSVQYADWQSCSSGVQYRNVLSVTPSGCALTSEQTAARQRTCQNATNETPTNNTGNPGITIKPVELKMISEELSESDLIAKGKIKEILAQLNLKESNTKEKNNLKKYVNVLIGKKSVKAYVRDNLNHFVTYGSKSTVKLAVAERAALVGTYKAAFSKLPTNSAEWSDILKIATGNTPTERNSKAELNANKDFKKIYGRDAKIANKSDVSAIMYMTYGLTVKSKNTKNEKAALKTFKAVYKHTPVTEKEKNIVKAIAYSGAKK